MQKLRKIAIYLTTICLTLIALLGVGKIAIYSDENDYYNRYNVMVVLDTSGSMEYTDANGLRYEAIRLFLGLLAEKGNVLGSVAFSNDVNHTYELSQVNDTDVKEKVNEGLSSVSANGYTNIGKALQTAVSMIDQKGDKNLPSVILLLSDGNTEMPTSDDTTTSLNQKAQALQDAKKAGIQVYSVCLNADQNANISEMEQISNATNGYFKEIIDVNDLYDAFNNFYSLIYGGNSLELANEEFPAGGELEQQFLMPAFGIEEVNIIIYGKTESVTLWKPDGSEAPMDVMYADTFTLLKSADIDAGEWTLRSKGSSGDNIRVNLVYNNNLTVEVATNPKSDALYPGDSLAFTAVLKSGDNTATEAAQYTGYSAELKIMDVYENEVQRIPMQVSDAGFIADYTFEEGAYFYTIVLKGNSITKETLKTGPINVSKENNTPPSAHEAKMTKTLYKWPFKAANLQLALDSLATDKEDDKLTYKIMSSSFIEGEDYEVKDNQLMMAKFSLNQGDFVIRAIDSGGLYTDIEVVVKTISIGLWTFIGCVVLGLCILLVMGIVLYVNLQKPFRGDIKVDSCKAGVRKTSKMSPKRGRCKLSYFRIDSIGLRNDKCYFQATKERYIYFISKDPVYYNSQKTNKIRMESGVLYTISNDATYQNFIEMEFQTCITQKRKRRR